MQIGKESDPQIVAQFGLYDDDRLAARLRQRPAWRNSDKAAYIERHIEFNRWFKERAVEAEPPITLLDTTEVSVVPTAAQVEAWVREKSGV